VRAFALVLVWSLWGCSSVSGPADWLLPDELTLGQGSSTSALSGGLSDGYFHDFDFDSTSDIESTYAALTWDLPGIEKSDGMSRETQRNMALLLDKMVAEEIGEVDDSDSPATVMTLRDGAPTPPWWLPYVFGGGILLFLAFMGLKSRSNGWH
jgi:hypothetical protein